MHLFLIASCYFTSKALVTTSDALVPTTDKRHSWSIFVGKVGPGYAHTPMDQEHDVDKRQKDLAYDKTRNTGAGKSIPDSQMGQVLMVFSCFSIDAGSNSTSKGYKHL